MFTNVLRKLTSFCFVFDKLLIPLLRVFLWQARVDVFLVAMSTKITLLNVSACARCASSDPRRFRCCCHYGFCSFLLLMLMISSFGFVVQLTKDEQQLLRGVGGDRRLCDECKRNPSQKKIEKNNGIVKVLSPCVRACVCVLCGRCAYLCVRACVCVCARRAQACVSSICR